MHICLIPVATTRGENSKGRVEYCTQNTYRGYLPLSECDLTDAIVAPTHASFRQQFDQRLALLRRPAVDGRDDVLSLDERNEASELRERRVLAIGDAVDHAATSLLPVDP
jgi:hypothetical protein